MAVTRIDGGFYDRTAEQPTNYVMSVDTLPTIISILQAISKKVDEQTKPTKHDTKMQMLAMGAIQRLEQIQKSGVTPGGMKSHDADSIKSTFEQIGKDLTYSVKALNGRTDEFANTMRTLSADMVRASKATTTRTVKQIDTLEKALGGVPSAPLSPSNINSMTKMENIAMLYQKGIFSASQARFAGQRVSMQNSNPGNPGWTNNGQNIFSIYGAQAKKANFLTGDRYQHYNWFDHDAEGNHAGRNQKAKFTGSNDDLKAWVKAFMGSVKNAGLGETLKATFGGEMTSHKLDKVADKFDKVLGNNIMSNLNQAFGSVPIIGGLTNFGQTVSKAYAGGKDAGNALGGIGKGLAGKGGALGKLGGALGVIGKFLGPAGAIATGVFAIYKRLKKASPVLQAVSSLFELAMNLFFMPIGNALGTLLLPAMEGMIDFSTKWNDLWTDFSWEKLGGMIFDALKGWWTLIFADIPSGIIGALLDWWATIFDTLGLHDIAQGIKDFKTKVDEMFQGVREFFQDPIGNITKAFEVLVAMIKSTFGNVGDSIGSFIDSINPFADGGLVTGPTLGLVGEAGPEVIMPLDNAYDMFANGSSKGITVVVQGNVYGDAHIEKIASQVVQRTSNRANFR